MSSIAPAAEDRPLPLRRRPDVRAVEQSLRGERMWTLKDPASLKYFHFSDEERFLFEQLDGRSSLNEIRNRFETRYAPRRIHLSQLHTYIGMLHREGLLLGDTSGQSDVLLERRHEHQRQERWARLASILAIRFRGVDPQPFLNWLFPKTRWLFSPAALAAFAALVISAVMLVAVHWSAVASRMPEVEQFLGGRNLLWIAATIAGIKVLHELGHALTLRHFGGECHEIGPMLLLFTPCLYCNTTDAWTFSNKWHRAAVAAAGIGIEIVLAAIATFLWWWSEPGLFHSICFDVMFVSSVSTLLFNGNPLLRYDGYYVLADLVEVPNLAQQSTEAAHNALANWFFGTPISHDQVYRRVRRGWLIAYWAASFVYRLFVVALVLWGLNQLLAPYHLDVLVGVVAVSALVGMVGVPSMRAIRFSRDPQWRERLNLGRFYRRGAFAIVLGAIILFMPLPARVTCPVVLRPVDAERVYVTVPGFIAETKQPGDTVRAGELIAQLRNPEIMLAAERAFGERDRQRLHVKNLKSQAVQSSTAAEQIPAAESAFVDREEQLQQRLADVQRLKIAAPCDGLVIAPPAEKTSQETPGLKSWQGSPLDLHNKDAFLKTGTLVCLVGDPTKLEGVAIVNQQDVDLVAPNQIAALSLDLQPGRHFTGEITEISPSRVDELPQELSGADDLPQTTRSDGKKEPAERVYQARVRLDDPSAPLLMGTTGTVKIYVQPRSIAARIARFLQSTFRVEW